MSFVQSLLSTVRQRRRVQTGDVEAATLWTTPWAWRDEEGVYTGHNGQVWLYRMLPLSPLEWEDAPTRLTLGQQLASMLATLGSTSRVPVGALRTLSRNRELHLLSITWESQARPPEGTPDALAEYQQAALGFLVPRRVLLVGVRLWPAGRQSDTNTSLVGQLSKVATKVLAEDVPDRSLYDDDRELVSGILARFGARKLDREATAQLESWYNHGRGPDVAIVEDPSSLTVGDFDEIEIAAVMRFANPVMHAPDAQWILDAAAHADGPRVVSVRAELEPAAVARARARRSQRRVMANIEEEAATGDLERVENSQAFQQAQAFERFLIDAAEPILTNCSILMVRDVSAADETYMDFLEESYGVQMKPLEHRQLPALDETLPCSSKRVNPFLQDVSISMLAFAGMNGFSNLGDRKGVYVGLADPDLTPVFLDPLEAPRRNLPPAMLVAGDPGSGKTFLCQNIATQATLAGYTTIVVNPKGHDSLASFAELVNGQVVRMSALEGEPGAFDPFRYAPPEIAAEIANTHILSVLEVGFTQQQRLNLGQGLKRGAFAGARCVGEALRYVDDAEVVKQVLQQVEASATFGLGVALNPRPRFDELRGLTLIEFDRKLDLPDPKKTAQTYTTAERIALAAIRLVTRASLEILALSNGGMLVVDEAWTFLSHSEGLAALQQLSREGRSLNILPVFATQKVADVLDSDLESYLSRVFAMKISDPADAAAALKLCGLEPTPARVQWLADCGPKPATDETPAQWPMGLHRDLDNRHSAVLFGPIPEVARAAWSTNPEDRARRAAERAARESGSGADGAGPDGRAAPGPSRTAQPGE